MLDSFRLNDYGAIVTGASRGLGQSIAIGLARAGADVMVTDVEDPSETVNEINESPQDGEALGMTVDVTERAAVRTMVEETRSELGSLDVLINNAGIYRPVPFEELEETNWTETLDVNLKGQYYCAQEAGEVMIEQESGSIVNIASVAGFFAFADSTSYNVSKGGVLQLTRSLASEWGQYGIRVNAICPGVFETKMTEDLLEDEEFVEGLKEKVPLNRTGKSDELAPTAVYLASKASSYMTGHALVIDGGWTCHL